jgi:hypothetical protein
MKIEQGQFYKSAFGETAIFKVNKIKRNGFAWITYYKPWCHFDSTVAINFIKRYCHRLTKIEEALYL